MIFHAIQVRHRLLPCLILLSLLLHVLAIAWVDLHVDWPAPRPAAAPLAVRIMAAGPAPAEALAPPAEPEPEPEPAPQPGPAPQSEPEPIAPAQLPSIAEAAAPPSLMLQAQPEPSAPAPAIEDAPRPVMPGTYRSRPAHSVRIDYRMTRADGAGPAHADGSARLDWETDGSTYRLVLDGVLGDMRSEGGLDDAGIAPQRALEALGPGQATTLFDRAERSIASAIGTWRAPLVGGSQDSASVLLQLGGIGRSDPDQLRSGVRIWVGGAAGARAERYLLTAHETIETGIGALETVRLARQGEPDAPLLEVWLAPGQSWLPVQLRLSTADGAVRTQTATAIESTAAAQDD